MCTVVVLCTKKRVDILSCFLGLDGAIGFAPPPPARSQDTVLLIFKLYRGGSKFYYLPATPISPVRPGVPITLENGDSTSKVETRVYVETRA